MPEAIEARGDRFARVAAGAVLFVPAVAMSFDFPERFRFAKLMAGEGLAFLGALATVAAKWRWGGRPARWSDFAWDLTVGAAVISLLMNSTHPLTGWQDVARLASYSMAFSLFRAVDNPWRLAPLVILAAGINALLALMQAGGMGLWESTREGRHAVYGTFGNPNFLAEWLAIAVPVLALSALEARSRIPRALAGAVIGATGAAFVACGGRAAALGLVTASPILALAAAESGARPGRGRSVPRFAAVLAAAGILFVGVLAIREWRVGPVGEVGADPTTETRSLMRRVAGQEWRTHPWMGVGPGGYGLGFLDGLSRAVGDRTRPAHYPGITREAHSDPAQGIAERGLIGAVAWMAALLLAARVGSSRPARQTEEFTRLFAFVAALMAAGVIAFISFPFQVFPTAVLALWVVAVVAGEFRAGAVGPVDAGTWWYGVARPVAGAAALLLLGRATLAEAALGRGTEPALREGLKALPTHGELHFRLGLGLVGAGRLAEAESEFEAAKAGFPDPDVWFNLGWIALQRKDYAASAERFHEGLRLYPFFKAPAWADYALALKGLGKRDEAMAAARRALEIDPGLGRARVLLTELERGGNRR